MIRKDVEALLNKYGIGIYRFEQIDLFTMVLFTDHDVPNEMKQELKQLFTPAIAIDYAPLTPNPGMAASPPPPARELEEIAEDILSVLYEIYDRMPHTTKEEPNE